MTAQLDQGPPYTPAAPRGWASSLVSPLALVVLGALTVLFILAFRAWPELDLIPAALFYDESHFVATGTAELVRLVLYVTPWIVTSLVLALSLAKGSRLIRVWAPCRRGLALLTLSLALGPGLLVNAILKDNVHRPRPNQTAEFGGPLEFRSVGSIEGGCPRNCSFVSGEVSIAAWTVSVALLAPISVQPVAIAAALVLTAVAGLTRMSVGAHFLSDTLLAMLFTWLVVIVTWWAVFGSPQRDPEGSGLASDAGPVMTAQRKSGEAHDAPSPELTAGTTTLLAVSCGTMAASLYYGQPLVGLIGPDLHLRPDLYGLVVTLTQLGYVLGLLFLVPLGDMLESRRLVTITICLTAGALAAAAAAPNAPVFLAMALCIGLFCTALQMLVPLAAHLAPDAIRGRVVGTVMSGLITGILLARPIASLLSEVVGWRGVFGLASVVVLALAALLYFRLPNRAPDSRLAYADLIGSMWRLLRDTPILRRRIAYQAPVFAGFSIFWTAVPLELAASPWTLSQTGIALFALAGAAGALVAPLAGRVADAGYSRSGTGLSLTSVLAGFGFCAFAGAAGLWALVCGAILIDAGVQGNQIISQRAIYGLAPAIRSRLNGLFIACSFVAASLGSLLAGAVFAHFGWRGVALMGALCPVAALAVWVQELRSTRGR